MAPIRVFLSHSKVDRKWSLQLRDQLQTAGLSVFIDESIDPGSDWAAQIPAEIEKADWLFLVASPESLASRWCQKELRAFGARKIWSNIQVFLRQNAPLDAFTDLVQRPRVCLSPRTYDTFLRSVVKEVVGVSAVAKLVGPQQNEHWSEGGRLAPAAQDRLLDLVAEILGDTNADLALQAALKLDDRWRTDLGGHARLLANALIVDWKVKQQSSWLDASLAMLDALEREPERFLTDDQRRDTAKALRNSLAPIPPTIDNRVSVIRVTDPDAQADAILEALAVYERIPADERVENDDLLALTRDHIAYTFGAHWEQYFLIATCGGRVVGMLVAYDDVLANYTFVSGLAVRRPTAADPAKPAIARRLLTEMLRVRGQHGEPGRTPRIVAEIDDPSATVDAQERRRRCSRLRLFATLAALDKIDLRVPDLQFLQPSMRALYTVEPRHLLLLYAAPDLPNDLPRDEVRALARWIFREIYPADSFVDEPDRDAYIAHARGLMHRVIDGLEERVRLRRVGEVLAVECGDDD